MTPFQKWAYRLRSVIARRLFRTEIDYQKNPGWNGWDRRVVYLHPCNGDSFDSKPVELKLSFWDNLYPKL